MGHGHEAGKQRAGKQRRGRARGRHTRQTAEGPRTNTAACALFLCALCTHVQRDPSRLGLGNTAGAQSVDGIRSTLSEGRLGARSVDTFAFSLWREIQRLFCSHWQCGRRGRGRGFGTEAGSCLSRGRKLRMDYGMCEHRAWTSGRHIISLSSFFASVPAFRSVVLSPPKLRRRACLCRF